MPRDTAPVVLKLGGSLLDLPDLRGRLEDVLRRCRRSPLLLVVGGGAAADLVRDWDRLHGLGDDISHCLALEAMSLNARCLAALLTDAEIVHRPEECDPCWRRNRLAIINAAEFVPSLETTCGERLPRSWDVTSDSISAWIAGGVAADRLVLLKSVDVPDDDEPVAGCDVVDLLFSTMIRRVRRIEWLNLRGGSLLPREVRIQ